MKFATLHSGATNNVGGKSERSDAYTLSEGE